MNMQLDPHVRAVFDDIVAHTPDIGPTPSGDVMNLVPGPSHQGRRWLAVAAAAIVVVGVGALVAVQRPNSETPDVVPATQPPAPVADVAPGGALVFDQTPAALQNATVSAGNRFEPATSGELAGTTVPVPVRRWYISNATQPELAAWIAIDSFPPEQMAPDFPPDAEAITVQGVDGRLYDAPVMTGRSIAFTLGDTTYVLTADHLTDSDLAVAAEHVRAADDGYGAVIDPAGLTDGLTEQAAGTTFETFFISRQALEHPIPQTHWDASDKSMWVSALAEDPTLLPLHRLGYATVTETTVHGKPAYLTTLGDFQPEYRGVTWSANGVTYLLGSNNFDNDTIVGYANLLRPATRIEWNNLLAEPPTKDAPDPTIAPTTVVLSEAPTESSVPAEPGAGAGYTPLALSEPPEGYRLVSARWGTGPGGGGRAVYANPDSRSRLEVVSTRRDGSQPTVTEPGRPIWEVAGYTVTATIDSGCSREGCGIDLQWDAHTFATLTWSGPEGGELEPAVTIEALLGLVPRLAPSTAVPAVADLIADTSSESPVQPVP